jgi:precorrin-6B methylase 2
VSALEEIDIKTVLEALRSQVPHDARVLDVGACTAFVAVRLARRLPAGVVYSADPCPDWVDYLRCACLFVQLPHRLHTRAAGSLHQQPLCLV